MKFLVSLNLINLRVSLKTTASPLKNQYTTLIFSLGYEGFLPQGGIRPTDVVSPGNHPTDCFKENSIER